jgi:Ras-related GTP-binding protein A/B
LNNSDSDFKFYGIMSKKKVLLMGKSGAGKTSMRSIIFANYMARDTMRLSPTLDVEHSQVRLLGGLLLNLWDCGGQYRFYESYFDSQRDTIFRNVEVLIYVFDIDSVDQENDNSLFDGVIDAMEQNSPEASIFILLHKMDLVRVEDRQRVFNERSAQIRARSQVFSMRFFATSIWDETLYRAWSQIVNSLIPNIETLQSHLNDFATLCAADEVVLFERATFLVISDVSRLKPENYDSHRFERISNIIKQFKLSCGKIQSQFQGIEVRNSLFTAYIDMFTGNTYIMVIMSNTSVPAALTQLNIAAAREHFALLMPEHG